MDRNDPQTWIIYAVVVVLLLIVAWLLTRQRLRSRHLEGRFGPEYRRLVGEYGNRTKAEAELSARERRIERLRILPLSPTDAAHFSEAWRAVQARFVDNPTGVVGEADRLVRDLMVKRGYPMADFEHRAADISVDHPNLVETYRLAQAVAVREQRGQATTEDLRKAVIYYRTLFDELLEVRAARAGEPAMNEVLKS